MSFAAVLGIERAERRRDRVARVVRDEYRQVLGQMGVEWGSPEDLALRGSPVIRLAFVGSGGMVRTPSWRERRHPVDPTHARWAVLHGLGRCAVCGAPNTDVQVTTSRGE